MQLVKPNIKRSWLASWLQDRRRKRASAVRIELWLGGPGYLSWSCSVYSPCGFTIGHSDDGLNWDDFYDGANGPDTGRDIDSATGYFRIARTDEDGLVVLPYSNVVYVDGL